MDGFSRILMEEFGGSLPDDGRLALLETLWTAIRPTWQAHMAECGDFAQVLVRGLASDGPERRRILDEQLFYGTYSRATLENSPLHS